MQSRPSTWADSGVCGAGLSTTELPAASAAATKAMTAVGPFHGTMIADDTDGLAADRRR